MTLEEGNTKVGYELSVADKKKLFVLDKLKEEYDLTLPNENEPLKFHWQTYDKWISTSGIEGYDQLHRILSGLQKEGLIINHRWVNPAR